MTDTNISRQETFPNFSGYFFSGFFFFFLLFSFSFLLSAQFFLKRRIKNLDIFFTFSSGIEFLFFSFFFLPVGGECRYSTTTSPYSNTYRAGVLLVYFFL